jgi:Flp pilus assembly protein TadD
MSLLNDALRKKKGEQKQINGSPKEALLKPGTKVSGTKRRQFWIIVGCVVLLTAVIGGIWFYRSALSVPSLLVHPGPTPSDVVQPEPDASIVSENQGLPATPSTAVSTAPEATAAEPKAATPPISSPPKVESASSAKTAKPTSPVPKLPVKKQTAGRQAKSKTASTRKPKAPERSRSQSASFKRSKHADKQRRLNADRLYQKARLYHRRNRFDQAIALYQEVMKIEPEHYNARFNLGAAYLQTEAYTKAYYIMADLYLNEPENQQVMLNLAIADIGCRRFNDALALLDKAATTPEPPLFEIAFHKGIVYNRLNKPQDALNWYKQAEALRPDDPRLLFNLAVNLDQQQFYFKAIDYYTRYIDQSPEKDDAKVKQIRRRIRALQVYQAQQNTKELTPQ